MQTILLKVRDPPPQPQYPIPKELIGPVQSVYILTGEPEAVERGKKSLEGIKKLYNM